jgi:Fe-S-cluster containining protein
MGWWFVRKIPNFTPGNVPCNGCTLCCQGDAVRLVPGHDDLSRYHVEPNPYFPGQYMLAHKANGDCIYLAETGCGIHPDRPYMCRTADCRVIPLRVSRKEARKAADKGLLRLEVWEQGRKLLNRS